MREIDRGTHYVYLKALRRLSHILGEPVGRLDEIIEAFCNVIMEGMEPPKRFFPIPGFGQFWRLNWPDRIEFVRDKENWPIGPDPYIGVPAEDLAVIIRERDGDDPFWGPDEDEGKEAEAER